MKAMIRPTAPAPCEKPASPLCACHHLFFSSKVLCLFRFPDGQYCNTCSITQHGSAVIGRVAPVIPLSIRQLSKEQGSCTNKKNCTALSYCIPSWRCLCYQIGNQSHLLLLIIIGAHILGKWSHDHHNKRGCILSPSWWVPNDLLAAAL